MLAFQAMPAKITIATRESPLALWQAQHVQALLTARGHHVTLLGITTRGDQILDRALSQIGGKGLFIKELELALEQGRADMAVHSLKDVPMELAGVLEREDPRDAFVSPHYASLDALPPGAVVGTSSLRRAALLRALRPDIRIAPLRGNVNTRLRKLDEGQYAAIVLAAAGLLRLGLQERIRTTLTPTQMLPAAGQGVLGIEIASQRQDVLQAVAPLLHQATWLQVAAERAVSRAMGGSCSMPLAAYAQWQGDNTLYLQAAWGDSDTLEAPEVTVVRTQGSARVTTSAEAETLGQTVARQLQALGARPL